MNGNIPKNNNISPEKLNILSKIISESRNVSNEEMIPFLLNAAAAASEKGITFSDEETMQIINSMKSNMSNEQIAKIDNIIKLTKTFQNTNRNKM